MERILEPELMTDDEQACAYALADFEEPHNHFIALFQERFHDASITGPVIDLGCGPGDIALRFARAYPACRVDGVDGSQAMIARFDDIAARHAGAGDRVRLFAGMLPGAELPARRYGVVISNSLLHHLPDPAVMWQSVKRFGEEGAPVFVMDLARPESPEVATRMVEAYVADEPEVLQRDFYNSLCAAFEPDEVRAQLKSAGLLSLKVSMVSDRHLTVHGRLTA
jgi:SAM-dependent methyltransferase